MGWHVKLVQVSEMCGRADVDAGARWRTQNKHVSSSGLSREGRCEGHRSQMRHRHTHIPVTRHSPVTRTRSMPCTTALPASRLGFTTLATLPWQEQNSSSTSAFTARLRVHALPRGI